MIILPAIDLKEGRCVRLEQGLMDKDTVYNDNPAEQARIWQDQGGELLHIVDLDGAFAGVPKNKEAIKAIVDEDSFFPLKERFGKSVVTALARLNGKSVGVIATNPMYKGGAMDPDACRKAASMTVLCDSFNIPLVFLVDTPGFLVGIEGERKAAPAQIMNMLHALQLSSVASVTVIMRKSYGQAYINLGGGRNSDSVAAWPTADVSFMDPHIGVSVITGLKRDDDPERFDQLKQDLVRDTSAFALAGAYGAQTVIRPQDTRQYLIDMLEMQKRPGLGDHELRAWPTYI